MFLVVHHVCYAKQIRCSRFKIYRLEFKVTECYLHSIIELLLFVNALCNLFHLLYYFAGFLYLGCSKMNLIFFCILKVNPFKGGGMSRLSPTFTSL